MLELLMFQKILAEPVTGCVKNPVIGDLVQQINQHGIKALSKVYLKGKDVNTFP
ncbi:hypothetical protein [Sporomusa sp.]|uniref:hypothetical protein n=1 Tax=Sporomusa sp. TaxID=2078658 RepID=UPI002CF68998|nr:hypothetical protein [Sporomusa sp.]HWR08536.1 hypothetical protein [Sporomusa sp.]